MYSLDDNQFFALGCVDSEEVYVNLLNYFYDYDLEIFDYNTYLEVAFFSDNRSDLLCVIDDYFNIQQINYSPEFFNLLYYYSLDYIDENYYY